MINVKIKEESKQLKSALKSLVNKQVAFASALAAKATAKEVRDNYILREYNKSFTVRNKQFGKVVHSISEPNFSFAKRTGVAVAAIKRMDAPYVTGTLKRREKVGKAPANTKFMERHFTGGVKSSESGKKLAIPLSNSPLTRRKSGAKAGKVNPSFQPKNVMDSGRGFIFKGKSGKSFLGREMKRGGKQVLYTLAENAQIKKTYNPIPAATRGAKARFPRNFRRSLSIAFKTAKLRLR